MATSVKRILGSGIFVKSAAAALLALIAASSAQAADIAGSKDPSFLKRYQGSDIIGYQPLSFDIYNMAVPDPKNPGSWVFTPIEGQITRIIYHVPPGHTVLELLRNYEQALKSAGLSQTAEHPPFYDPGFIATLYQQLWVLPVASTGLWTAVYDHHFQQAAYVSAKGSAGGQSVTVAVWVGSFSAAKQDVDLGHGIVHFTADSPIVIVDTIGQKAVVNKMVRQ